MKTLLLSGWTQPTDALAHLVDDAVVFDYSDYPNPDAAIEALKKIKPRHVVAWSMGGQLALRAIAAGAITPTHLTLIAAPMKFVSCLNSPLEGESNRSFNDSVGGAAHPQPPQRVDGLPPTGLQGQAPLPLKGGAIKGMDPLTFRLFRESYASDPARAKTRFHGLIAKGDARMRAVMEMLGHHPDVENISRWLPWLDDLGDYEFIPETLASAPPTLIIHGMNDHIVPHAQGVALARSLPNAQLNGWAQVGHAPHVHDGARARAEILAHRLKHGVE